MLVTVTARVAHRFGGLFRQADAMLSRGAVRNAAVGVAVRHARVLDDARTLHDLQRVEHRIAAERRDASNRP